MKLVGAVSVFLLVFISQVDGWRRRRARPACHAHNCVVSEWSMWSHCSHVCGEVQRRVRWKIRVESCGGTCHYKLSETRSCNWHCHNGGTPLTGYCKCQDGFTGRCCEYDRRLLKDDDFQQHIDPTDESDESPETGEIAALIIGGLFLGGVALGLTIKCFCKDCCKNCCNWFNKRQVMNYEPPVPARPVPCLNQNVDGAYKIGVGS